MVLPSLPLAALAAAASTGAAGWSGTAGSAAGLGAGAPELGRYLVVCGGLVVLVLALGLGFRKLLARAWKVRAGRRSLALVDVLPLGGKQRLAVVRCYDRSFVLGLGEREVALVAELDLEEAPAAAREPEPAAAAAPRAPFEELVRAAPPLAPREGRRALAPRGVVG